MNFSPHIISVVNTMNIGTIKLVVTEVRWEKSSKQYCLVHRVVVVFGIAKVEGISKFRTMNNFSLLGMQSPF